MLFKYCEKLDNPNTIGYEIAKGERKMTDDLVFQSAICFAKEYLNEVLRKGKV